jgi:putative Mg2+ transporter-C (MgtC) family protein
MPLASWRLHEALRFAERVMMEPVEIILRLGSATLIGAAIGVNRDLRGKPIGVRTLGLVGLVSAAAILAITYAGTDPRADAPSRVMQGVLTGIGFLGAGVIVRGR